MYAYEFGTLFRGTAQIFCDSDSTRCRLTTIKKQKKKSLGTQKTSSQTFVVQSEIYNSVSTTTAPPHLRR